MIKRNAGAPIPDGFTEVQGKAAFTTNNGPFYEKIIDDKTVIRAFRVLPEHLNSVNIVHGGMLMTFADSALARTVGYQTGRRCVTIKMNSEFMFPAREGDWVEAHVDLVRTTRTVVFVKADLKVGKRTIFKTDGIFHYVHVG
jgi:uncharacterized protein (TIGR00369 family)